MEYSYRDELYHHGILGQKWGVRRYQNEDGTLTADGKKRKKSSQEIKEARKNLSTEKKKLNEMTKRKDDIYADTTYSNDDIYDLFLEARDYWNEEENRPTTKEEDDERWQKYEKAFNKALSHNKEYSKLLKDIDVQKAKVSELEKMSKTKIGEDYVAPIMTGLGTVLAMVVITKAFDKL